MSVEVKSCLWCAKEFIQPKPPKATQVYCSYACYRESKREGVL